VINAPVMLTDTGTLKYGSTWSPDLEKMQSLTRDAVQIEEMRVFLSTTYQNVISVAAIVLMKLAAGNLPITNQFVSLSGIDGVVERYWSGTSDTSPGGAFGGTETPAVQSSVKWRFPRPMALNLGMPLRPEFKWITPAGTVPSLVYGTTADITVSVAFLGRTIEALPRKTCVPYTTNYIGAFGSTESKDTDLMNICDKPLNVAGLHGGGFFCAPGGLSAAGSAWADDSVLLGSSGGLGLTAPFVTTIPVTPRIKLFDQSQFGIVPFYSSFYSVFGPRMWLPTPGYILPPRGFLRAMSDTAAGLQPDRNMYYTPRISVTGWREEVMP
jgi:hypothetical protein